MSTLVGPLAVILLVLGWAARAYTRALGHTLVPPSRPPHARLPCGDRDGRANPPRNESVASNKTRPSHDDWAAWRRARGAVLTRAAEPCPSDFTALIEEAERITAEASR